MEEEEGGGGERETAGRKVVILTRVRLSSRRPSHPRLLGGSGGGRLQAPLVADGGRQAGCARCPVPASAELRRQGPPAGVRPRLLLAAPLSFMSSEAEERQPGTPGGAFFTGVYEWH